MLKRLTIREQILPVLRIARKNIESGSPVEEACQFAMHAVATKVGVTYQTIEDGCRRRLNLKDVRQFHQLVGSWLNVGSSELMHLLMQQAVSSAHEDIRRFFGSNGKVIGNTGHSLRDRSNEAGQADFAPPSIIVQNLDGDALDTLCRRAKTHGRSLSEEARATLTRALRMERQDFAMWTAGLRSRLQGRHKGDVTADIREDRER